MHTVINSYRIEDKEGNVDDSSREVIGELEQSLEKLGLSANSDAIFKHYAGNIGVKDPLISPEASVSLLAHGSEIEGTGYHHVTITTIDELALINLSKEITDIHIANGYEHIQSVQSSSR